MNDSNNNASEALKNQAGKEDGIFHMGYNAYNATDDIYNKAHNEVDIDPENTTVFKSENIENELDDNDLGNGLDIPGSELDDEQEKIGAEDEENNYYSLGLDNHNELEENSEG
jgi:hypothetical protein